VEALWIWLRRNIIRYLTPPKTIGIIDIIQVIILAWIIYSIFLWIKNTRAYTLLKGILFIAAFIIVAMVFRMQAILWMIQNLSIVAITALVIIFQPELRKALERVGHRNPISNLFALNRFAASSNERFSDKLINEVVRGVMELAENKTGALIIVEEDVKLDEVAETGIELDALVTSQLLINIFEHNTPLHDGAVIIRGDRVTAATCYLPLSDNKTLSKALGTRHRAGVGVSEATDSLTIIVSEETGGISMAYRGDLQRNVTEMTLRDRLIESQNKSATGRRKNHLFRRTK